MTTWKKGRNIVLAILFFLAGVTVTTTYRRTADRDYGRLFDEQLPPAPQPVVTRTVPVVTEGAPVAVETPAAVASAPAPTAPPPVTVASDDSGSIVITRPNGERPKVLSGGIFKPQE